MPNKPIITPFDEDTNCGVAVTAALDNTAADATGGGGPSTPTHATLADWVDTTKGVDVGGMDDYAKFYKDSGCGGSTARFMARNTSVIAYYKDVFPQAPFIDNISNHTNKPIVFKSSMTGNTIMRCYFLNHFIKFEDTYSKNITVAFKIDKAHFRLDGNAKDRGFTNLFVMAPGKDNWTDSSGVKHSVASVQVTLFLTRYVQIDVYSIAGGYIVNGKNITVPSPADWSTIASQIERDYLTFKINLSDGCLEPSADNLTWVKSLKKTLYLNYIAEGITTRFYDYDSYDFETTIQESTPGIVLPTDHKRYDFGTIANMQTNTAAPYWQSASPKVRDIVDADVVVFMVWEKEIIDPYKKGYTFDTSLRNITDLPTIQLEDGTGGVVHTEMTSLNPRCVLYKTTAPVTQDQIDNWIVVLRIKSTDESLLQQNGIDNFHVRAIALDSYLTSA